MPYRPYINTCAAFPAQSLCPFPPSYENSLVEGDSSLVEGDYNVVSAVSPLNVYIRWFCCCLCIVLPLTQLGNNIFCFYFFCCISNFVLNNDRISSFFFNYSVVNVESRGCAVVHLHINTVLLPPYSMWCYVQCNSIWHAVQTICVRCTMDDVRVCVSYVTVLHVCCNIWIDASIFEVNSNACLLNLASHRLRGVHDSVCCYTFARVAHLCMVSGVLACANEHPIPHYLHINKWQCVCVTVYVL